MTSNYFQNVKRGLDNVSFELTGVNTNIANALRRCILSEIPVYGFEDEPKHVFSTWRHNSIPIPRGINIVENTSSLHNEFISHRIGLIPIYCARPIVSEFNKDICDRVFKPSTDESRIRELEGKLMGLSADSEERMVIEELLQNEREMPEFTLDITNDNTTRQALKNGDYYKTFGRDCKVDISSNNIVRVTSDMFHTKLGDELDYIKYDPRIFEEFKDDKGEGLQEYAVIVTLKPGVDGDGQSLKAVVRPNPGIARYHSKYCPVGTVSYSFKRIEDTKMVRTTFEKSLRQTNRTRVMKGLEPLETEIFSVDDTMTSEDPEVLKLWNNFQIIERDRLYETVDGGAPKYYMFNVESIGSLEPVQIVHDALYMLRLKLIDIFEYAGDDGFDYITFTRSSGVMPGIDITINNENHTMGNIITGALNDNPAIDFAGYKMPHPLQERIVFRITLQSGDNIDEAIAIFKDSVYKTILTITELIQDWSKKNTDLYVRLLDTTTETFLNNTKKNDVTSTKSSTSTKSTKSRRKVKVKVKKIKKTKK